MKGTTTMSDIREHAPFGINARLLYLTQHAAFERGTAETGAPKTAKEKEEFQPPEWVLLAVRRAYESGRAAGAEEIRRSMRSLLGVREA